MPLAWQCWERDSGRGATWAQTAERAEVAVVGQDRPPGGGRLGLGSELVRPMVEAEEKPQTRRGSGVSACLWEPVTRTVGAVLQAPRPGPCHLVKG